MSAHSSPRTNRPDDAEPAVSARTALSVLLSAVAGAGLALWLIPTWLPAFSSDLAAQQAPWHLARASGVVAYILLWLSTALGLSITNRLARLWPGGPYAFDLHQFSSLLALAVTAFHVLILLGDHYINYSLAALLVPFAAQDYKPVATAWGQIGFYVALLVSFSFYVRQRIGRRAWRLVHFASFLVYGLVTVHGLFAGSDSAALLPLYAASILSILFLTNVRIFSAIKVARSTA